MRNGRWIEISMERYISKLELVSVPCTLAQFRSSKAQAAWTVNFRPDTA